MSFEFYTSADMLGKFFWGCAIGGTAVFVIRLLMMFMGGDSDGDGFIDSIDACPTSPETWNKYRDNDGCPDIAPEQQRFAHDEDLDHIINDKDSCPLDPEDYDGDRDFDGCPDP